MNNRAYMGSVTKYNKLGEGIASTVYLCDFFETCFAYKEYKTSDEFKEFIRPRLEMLSEFYKDNRFVFPYKFIFKHPKDELFQGYIMNYLYNFEKLSDLTDMDYVKKVNVLKNARNLLNDFHKDYKLIHTDITPWNFLYNKDTNNVTLIDFDTCIDLEYKKKLDDKFNILSQIYSKYNGQDKDLDIYMFNLTTYALLNNIPFYKVIDEITNNNFGYIENNNAIEILDGYKDIETNTLKKEYIIDYL